MNWSLITASNNETVLKSCLAASPCIARARDINVIRGYASAGAAYNAGMRKAAGDILVFAHQDVYLPERWDECLIAALQRLSSLDPAWAVAGVFGIAREDKPCGHTYCTGLQRLLGRDFADPSECSTLDEIVLIVRRSSGLVFDEQVPGFHFYGTDICLEAQRRGLKSYIVPAFCIHNTEGLTFLPLPFWRAYFYMRRKWRDRLPIRTPCTVISKWGIPFLHHPVQSAYARYVKGERPGTRVSKPEQIYARLLGEKGLRGPVGGKNPA